jgi:hypothetical protein
MNIKRITIDLSVAAAEEVERISRVTGLSVADVFRNALSAFRIEVNAGKHCRPESPHNDTGGDPT